MLTLPLKSFIDVTHIPVKDRKNIISFRNSCTDSNKYCIILRHGNGYHDSYSNNHDGTFRKARKKYLERAGYTEVFYDSLGEL